MYLMIRVLLMHFIIILKLPSKNISDLILSIYVQNNESYLHILDIQTGEVLTIASGYDELPASP